MTFSYNPGIPAANDPPANDQPLMLQNFGSISSLLAVDHVGFNTAGGGEHNQISFALNQVAPSLPGGAVSEAYVNSVAGLLGTFSSLFFNDGTNNLQLTNLPLTTVAFSGGGNTYGIKTPWGLIINFGNPVIPNNPQTVPFAIPMMNAQYCAFVTPNINSISVTCAVNAMNATKFDIYTSRTGITIFYLAIGK